MAKRTTATTAVARGGCDDGDSGGGGGGGDIEVCQESCRHTFTEKEVGELRNKLLQWYDDCQRELPWRQAVQRIEDKQLRAYKVWVSEIMLQQTQVKTVCAYYERWMKKWPTVARLAKATPDDVQKMWAGLGYYSRGQRLLKGAKHVMDKLEGKIPETYDGLRTKLPGVGPYTAAAIASIAFGYVKGVVDGNVYRVLSRLRRITQPVDTTPVQKAMQSLSDDIVDRQRPGDFNQAVMELGATVCLPKNPACSTCPLASLCASKRRQNAGKDAVETVAADGCTLCSGTDTYATTDLPRKKPKKQSPVFDFWCLHVRTSTQRVILSKNPEKGLLANAWTLPCLPHSEHETPAAAARALLTTTMGLSSEDAEVCPVVYTQATVDHVFSHQKHRYHVVHVHVDKSVEGAGAKENRRKWVHVSKVAGTITTTNMKKVWTKVKALKKREAGTIMAAFARSGAQTSKKTKT